MNTNQKHPNLEISTHGTLSVMPVDAEALKKLINDEITKMNQLIDSKMTSITEQINKMTQNTLTGFGDRHSNVVYEFIRDFRAKGYYKIPQTGWLVAHLRSAYPHTFFQMRLLLNPDWIDENANYNTNFAKTQKQPLNIRNYYVIAAVLNNGHARSFDTNAIPVKKGDILTLDDWENSQLTDEYMAMNLYYNLIG